MDQVERIARAVSQQRTGGEGRWQGFTASVEEALKLAAENPGTTARDYLDEPNSA
ncbi:hypothetical protein ACVII0_002766 [Sinorhizobium meliloti]